MSTSRASCLCRKKGANLPAHPLYLPTGWMRLSRLTGAPVLPTVNYRLPDGRHLIQVLPELSLRWADPLSEELQYNGQRLMDLFDPHFRARPEMVDWMYWLVRVKESEAAAAGSVNPS